LLQSALHGANHALKILILKPSSLGDVIHALPVLRLLKLHWPNSEVFWWLDAGLFPLLKDDPDIAGLFAFHRRRWAAPGHWAEIAANIRAMRRERFDVAIDLQGLARSAFFAWFANANLCVGLDNIREGAREGARLAYDQVPARSQPGAHAVDRYLSILPLLGVPVHDKFQWLPERPQIAARTRQRFQPGSARWIALLPGARWDNKRWPIEYFVDLARKLLASDPEIRISILGARSDKNLGHQIAGVDTTRCLDLTGCTTLPEMIEWLRLCELVITNDSGPMHVAAALRKPVIAVFGPTNPNATGPYGQLRNVLQNRTLPCVPCLKSQCYYSEHLACLKSITPAQVCSEALKQLEQFQKVSVILSPRAPSPTLGERAG